MGAVYQFEDDLPASEGVDHELGDWGDLSFLIVFFRVWRLLQNQTRMTSRSKFSFSASSVISEPRYKQEQDVNRWKNTQSTT